MTEATAPEIIEFPDVQVVQSGMASLAKKMAQVMGAVSRIEKNGTHPHHHYQYATSDDIFHAVRRAMAEANLAVFPDLISYHQEPVGKQVRTFGEFTFTFVCGDTGASKVCQWKAEADDTQDKGINKVATAALKNFLLKSFVMSTGEDTEDTEANPTPAEMPMTRAEFVDEMKVLGYQTEDAMANALKAANALGITGLKKYETMLATVLDWRTQQNLIEFVDAPEIPTDEHSHANLMAALEDAGFVAGSIGNIKDVKDGYELIPNEAGNLNAWVDLIGKSKGLALVKNGSKSIVVKYVDAAKASPTPGGDG